MLRSHRGAISKLLFLGLVGAMVRPADAAEIILEKTAVDKLLLQTLFKDEGRRYLSRSACETYIETPTTTLKEGRLTIRFHLTAKVGVPAGKVCVGPTLTSWSTVSGRPVAESGAVRLEDIQVEEVENSKVRFLLKTGLAPAVPKALELDVKKAVGSMLKASSPQIESSVETVQITSVLAEHDKLSVQFDFRLVAR